MFMNVYTYFVCVKRQSQKVSLFSNLYSFFHLKQLHAVATFGFKYISLNVLSTAFFFYFIFCLFYVVCVSQAFQVFMWATDAKHLIVVSCLSFSPCLYIHIFCLFVDFWLYYLFAWVLSGTFWFALLFLHLWYFLKLWVLLHFQHC